MPQTGEGGERKVQKEGRQTGPPFLYVHTRRTKRRLFERGREKERPEMRYKITAPHVRSLSRGGIFFRQDLWRISLPSPLLELSHEEEETLAAAPTEPRRRRRRSAAAKKLFAPSRAFFFFSFRPITSTPLPPFRLNCRKYLERRSCCSWRFLLPPSPSYFLIWCHFGFSSSSRDGFWAAGGLSGLLLLSQCN